MSTHEQFQKIFHQFEKWLEQRHQYSAHTFNTYMSTTKAFVFYLERAHVARIQDCSLDNFIQFISRKSPEQNYSMSTIRLRRSALHTFYSWAERVGYSPLNLANEYKKAILNRHSPYRLKVPEKKSFVMLSPEEQTLFYRMGITSDFATVRNQCMALLILETGLSVKEILTLCVADIHLKENGEGYILVGEEANKVRTVDIVSEQCGALCKRWLQLRGQLSDSHGKDWLFCSKGQLHLTSRALHKAISLLLMKAGIRKEHMGPQVLRQTAIANMLKVGKSLEDIRKLTGIQTISQIEQYQKFVKPLPTN